MNKYDSENNATMMAIIDAERRHPKPSDGQTHRFPHWDQPLVQVNAMYGRAIAYTHSYGLISWVDASRSKHVEWFPADLIKRVSRENWHGH